MYNSQVKVSERQKWGASHVILYYGTTQHKCVNQIPPEIFILITWQGKEKAETQAHLRNPAARKSLHTTSHCGKEKKKKRQKSKQALTSSFTLFTLFRIQLATTPPTGNTKKDS